MKIIGSIAARMVIVLVLLGSFIAPGFTQSIQVSPSAQSSDHPRQLKQMKKVPEEVRELFRDGISIEEFLELNRGTIPQFLQKYNNVQVDVIVEMEGPPLAEIFARRLDRGRPMATASQKAYIESLNIAQEAVAASLDKMGSRVIDRYTKSFNGILAAVPLNLLAAVRQLPGVKAIHRAPIDAPALAASVPLIRAEEVINSLGFDGTGVTIAIIDSGIDYTHAAFGGSGDPNEYANNNPNIVEFGTFPTTKIIGGFDFVGTKYNASCTPDEETADICSKVPVPDPDPLDEMGHGTHVASIAAGEAVTGTIGHGVAPGASQYALKVFGKQGTTTLTMSAIEWAVDPNGDGDLSDHVDVINMSLVSRFGPATNADPKVVASNNASHIGVVVIAAAGNSGNTPYITGSPASADAAISVAASSTGYVTGPTISIVGSTAVTQTNIVYQSPAFDNDTGHFTSMVSGSLFYVSDIPGAGNDEMCSISGLPPDVLNGKLALIQRGTCAFSTKVNNAGAIGAVGAIIFNHSTGGNNRVTMAGSPVSIPAGFITHDDGLNLIPVHEEIAEVTAEDDVATVVDLYISADTIADFSSRGPRGFDSFSKPDITAPGVGIFAANMGSGVGGINLSGTSMATPHVAGVAALMVEAHPDRNPEEIKAIMMNTAIDLADSGSAQVSRQGAGRVDAYKTITATTFALSDPDLVSLNWGVLHLNGNVYTDQKVITLQNLSVSNKIYNISWKFGPDSFAKGISLAFPGTVELTGSGMANVTVALAIDATQIPSDFLQMEEYNGYLVFTNTADSTDVLRVPFYVIPQPHSQLTVSNPRIQGLSGSIEITHSGPITSSLWAYPLYIKDINEVGQSDEGDIRLVGMDFGGIDPSYGPLFTPALNIYGSWHTPQPYFTEIDLYLDVNQDGLEDFVDFNWNYGAALGVDDNDLWIVVQYEVSSGIFFLGSPYEIYTDYNTGFMEWYLPAEWHNMSIDTDLNFQVIVWDYSGNFDLTKEAYFDFARLPFGWDITTLTPGSSSPTATLSFWVDDPNGYLDSYPLGMMVVDYMGTPGVGQVYEVLLDFPLQIHLPIVVR